MRALLLIPLLIIACGDDAPPDKDLCDEPTYLGEASDEAWYVMLDAYDLATTGGDAASITVPAEGEAVSGETPLTLTWTSPLAAGCPLSCYPGGFPLPLRFEAAAAIFAPAARAHLPPVSGDIHYLEVVVPGRDCPITAITTDEQWRPSAAEWGEMRGRGPLRLVITSAYLEKNRIIEGPYRSTRTFRVQ